MTIGLVKFLAAERSDVLNTGRVSCTLSRRTRRYLSPRTEHRILKTTELNITIGSIEVMSNPRIRQASVEDAERLAAVYRNAYQENRRLGFPAKAESVTVDTVAEWIRAAHVFIGTVREDVVGGVRLEATDSDKVKLSRLGVHEEWKSQGIGSKLADFAEEWVRDAGYAIIWLTTPEEHPYLPEFYRDRGYETTGHYPLEYRDYNEIIMEKNVG